MLLGVGVVVGNIDVVGGFGVVVEGVEGVFDGFVEEIVVGEVCFDDVGYVVVECGLGRLFFFLIFFVDYVLMEVEDIGDVVGVEDLYGVFDLGQVSVVVDVWLRFDVGLQYFQLDVGEFLCFEEGCVVFIEIDGIGGVGGVFGDFVDFLCDDYVVLGVGYLMFLGGLL